MVIRRRYRVRSLTEVDLWEVSLVTFPANEKARVTNVKFLGLAASPDDVHTRKDAEGILRQAGFSKSDATALVWTAPAQPGELAGEERSQSAKSTAQAINAANRLLTSLSS